MGRPSESCVASLRPEFAAYVEYRRRGPRPSHLTDPPVLSRRPLAKFHGTVPAAPEDVGDYLRPHLLRARVIPPVLENRATEEVRDDTTPTPFLPSDARPRPHIIDPKRNRHASGEGRYQTAPELPW